MTSRRHGYVLLLVIATLAIATVAMVQIATHAMRGSVHSLEATQALRAKWAHISCERATLAITESVFERLDQQREQLPARERLGSPPVFQLRETIELGGQQVTLVLADESAKAHLPTLLRTSDPAAADRALKALVGMEFQLALSIRMPRKLRSSTSNAPGAINDQHWGTWIDLGILRQQHGDDRALASATRNITLWGPGKLNIYRTADITLTTVVETVSSRGVAQKLLEEIRNSETQSEVELLLRREVQDVEERTLLENLLDDASDCYSVWTEVTNTRGVRSQSFAVQTRDENGLRATRRLLMD